MLADGRTFCYGRALQKKVSPGAVVLDIGTGVGIMALLACRAGAQKVYAIEPDDVVQVARKAAVANGFSDRIEFLQASSLAIDLPERVDGIVSDIRGVLPHFGTGILSILDARDRFLAPNGWMIPARDSLSMAVIACPARHASLVEPWETGYGFDFSQARANTVNSWSRASVRAEELVVDPQQWAVLDYRTLAGPSVAGDAEWTVDGNAVAHGLCVWFDCETAPGIGFSNSPVSDERHIYEQGFFPWPRGTELRAGDKVRVRLRADFVQSDYVWTWTTRVIDGTSGSIKAAYDQSTFHAMPFSRDRLRMRAHTYIPAPGDDARIDRRILELMGDAQSIGAIADRILAEFPSRFRDWNAALTRVGDLSNRYSTSR